MNYRQITVDATRFFDVTSGHGREILDGVKAAIAAGESPFIRPTSFFPASFTLTGQPAYETFEKGCSNLRARGMLRITIAHPLAAGGPPPSAQLNQKTDRARVLNVYATPGQTIDVADPGVMLRSVAGFWCGIPGGQATKYGVLKGHDGKGTVDRPHVDLGGGFIYTANHDAPIGAVEEVVFLLIVPDKWTQPFDSIPYFDPETHPEYCGLHTVPNLNKGMMKGYGDTIARAFEPYKDKIAWWSAPVNEPEYRVFYPRRRSEEDNAPDLDALYDEVFAPFMDGLNRVLWRDAMYAGPDTGSPDVLRWFLAQPRYARDIITFHVYSWAGETFPDAIAFKLDNWLKPQLDGVGWHGKVILTELGDLAAGVGAVGTSGGFTKEKWDAVLPILRARPWISAAFNPLTGLVEEITR